MNIKPICTAVAAAAALAVSGSATAWTSDQCDWALATTAEDVPVEQPHEEAWNRAAFVEYRDWCETTAADARQRLAEEFGIDAGDLTAQQSIARLAAENEKRRMAHERDMQARHEEEQRRYEAEARRQEDYARQQMSEADRLAREQNEMLKGLGVDLAGVSVEDEEEEDELSPTELSMYQKMVESGVAPHCKGLKGARLVDCVDEALDAEED